ncbi:amino acid permease/ SLC12A domain-containing protein [Phlebopus sp. FC_14]|nr:amino acid permease/ SLC12A domain-containing protein [Phlebopus sp. FC_14]
MYQDERRSHESNKPRIEQLSVQDDAVSEDPPYPPRRLKQRHIAGTLGTGLFLGSGEALSGAGPVGALIAYALVGTVVFASLCSLAEMTALAPVPGSFPYYASRWVDEALGFAVSTTMLYFNPLTIPVEISGAQLLITYWDKNHQAIYIAIMCCATCAINVFGVRRVHSYFGEAEFVFSTMKLTLITALILIGLVIDLGGAPDHDRLGFRYWKDPGPFAGAGLEPEHPALDRFLGLLSVIVQAAFSFQGMEIAAIAASETEIPRRNIAKAIRRTFFRILVFYILGIFIAGLVVRSDDGDLLPPFSDTSRGNATESPFVIAMSQAKIKVVPVIVNAGFITSAFSAGNSFLYCSSRILYGLAIRKQAPAFFARTWNGIPITAVLFTAAFGLLSFMGVSHGGVKAFTWFVSLSTVGGFFSWATMNLTYLRLYGGMKYQNIDRKTLHYRSPFQPWLSIWGLVWCIIFILISGFQVFWNFDRNTFLTSYINVPLFFCLYFFWKFSKGTHIWTVDIMNYTQGIPPPEETERPERKLHGFWEKLADILF